RKFVRMLTEKAIRQRVNKDNQLLRRATRKEATIASVQRCEFNDLVNTMTNRQRTRWARTKYKGLVRKDIKALEKFIADNPNPRRKAV
ncbi:hypothetical protein LCGC14_1943880, partial [marine sediment metagenome]